MNRKDVWLLGLFALAYLYLDARPALARSDADPEEPPLSPPLDEPSFAGIPAGIVPRSACPRNLTHRVSLRADGAMWCLACDEGFYPEGAIWGALMGSVAA